MKLITIPCLFLTLSFSAFSQSIILEDFNNFELTDISSLGLQKKSLFKKMNVKTIQVTNTICSNRAHLWSYDFKRFQKIDSGKIFLFYAEKTRSFLSLGGWWYHVAPVIAEKGQMYVMDKGFSETSRPLKKEQWLKSFVKTSACKEISVKDTDLISRMHFNNAFPRVTEHGEYPCYYMITPNYYWTPATIAKGILGVDEENNPVDFKRTEMNEQEVFWACQEATAIPLVRILQNSAIKCKKYLGFLPNTETPALSYP